MTTRRQRQAEAESRRKELVEQLERDRERVKKASEQVLKFGEACREVLGGIELTGEESSEATEILNEAAEDEMIEKIVDEIVEEVERAELLDQVPGSSYVLKDVPWNKLDAKFPEVSPDTNPETDSPPATERQDDLSDEQRPDAEVSGDVDKATPSGDGWE